MKGIYQHRGEKHLHRYLAEFDFRYSNRVRLGVDDTERTRHAIAGSKPRWPDGSPYREPVQGSASLRGIGAAGRSDTLTRTPFTSLKSS
jgi:hypothetical protein